MKITLTGGTGFIGTHLCNMLEQRGHELIILTRNPQKFKKRLNPKRSYRFIRDDMDQSVAESDAVINLAGENLVGRRWTNAAKRKLTDSRVDTTHRLVKAIEKAKSRPAVLISASASGYYGSRGDDKLTEEEPPGGDFAAEICVQWEGASQKAREFNVRVVNPRIGIVLENDGGALRKMLTPFYFFLGGPLGSGKQYFPWIHMRDLGNSMLFALEEKGLEGAYNASSPNPVTMEEFAKVLGKVMNRPSMFRVPEFALKLAFSEGVKAMTASLRLQPEVLHTYGFKFEYPELEKALRALLER